MNSLRIPSFLRAYVVKSLACRAIQAVVHSMWFKRVEASHPVIFARLQLTSVFGFAVLVMIPNLFDERKLRMLVKVVTWERKMVVKRSPGGLVYIVAMSVDPQIRRRLALSNILGLLAQFAVSKIDNVPAPAIQAMEYF